MNKTIEEYCFSANTGIYLFNVDKFESNFQDLLTAFTSEYHKSFISYSYKTNYTPYLCKIIDRLGGWAEIVSEMELHLTKKLGISNDKIIFNGPYKSDESLKYCINNKILINVDSIEELKKISALSKKNKVNINIRFSSNIKNNDFSRFGFDINSSDWLDAKKIITLNKNIIFNGVHCHFPHRDLSSFIERTRFIKNIILKVKDFCELNYVSIGGGFFSSLPKSILESGNLEQVSYTDYSKATAKPLATFFSDLNINPSLFIEPGTGIVADTFEYYCRVISVKSINNTKIATVNGSLLDVSASARYSNLPAELVNCNRSLSNNYKTMIAGYTCIESDVLCRSFKHDLEVGDIIRFGNVGSYSIVMKPPFILPASEIYALKDGKVQLIKDKEDPDYIFHNFKI